MNNPILYNDPLGDTIRIKNGTENFLYTPGGTYTGSNEFVSEAVTALNKLYTGGETLTIDDDYWHDHKTWSITELFKGSKISFSYFVFC